MKPIIIELKWAIIFTITMLAWMLFEKTLGWHDEQIADHYWLTLLFLPFAILMYVLVMREKRRRHYDKKMTWLQGFVTGTKMALFVALFSPMAQYITHNYITPEYFESVATYSVTNDLMSIEEANAYFNLNSYMLQSALGTLASGLVISALVAIFMRRSS